MPGETQLRFFLNEESIHYIVLTSILSERGGNYLIMNTIWIILPVLPHSFFLIQNNLF